MAGLFTNLRDRIFNKDGEPVLGYGTAPTLQASVPVAVPTDKVEQPALPWILEFLPAVRESVGNQIAILKNKHHEDDEDESSYISHDRLQTVRRSLFNAINIDRKKEDKGTTGEASFDLLDMTPQDLTLEDMREELTSFFTKAAERFGLAKPSKQHTEEIAVITDYKELFQTIPLPDIANTFDTDEGFVRMRLVGLNPMSITGVSKAELIAMIGDRITDQHLNDILNTEGDSVERAGEEQRLCVTNYKELGMMNPNMPDGVKFVTVPIAVFVEPISGSDVIKPIAIQLGQDPGESELIFADTVDIYRWQVAKQHVQVADANYHSFIEHLAYTHLVMEAFSIATQRCFADGHPLSRLLMPHVEGTNFINQLAGAQAVAQGGPITRIFAGNDEPRVNTIQLLIANTRTRFNFKNRMPDVELKLRKVDKLKVYPYRDDALLIWGALLEWAKDYIDLYYSSDSDVTGDEELMKWSEEIEDNAFIVNFESPKTKAELVRTLAMFMFLASAQHACMNFSQRDYLTFAPNATGAIWDNLPSDDPLTEEQYLKMLPGIEIAQLQLFLVYIVGGVRYRRLGQYQTNSFPYHGTLERKASDILKKFNSALEEIEEKIKKANVERGHLAYEYMLPSKIPPSINI